ncbi:MAG: 2-amino-4-hydroxy-6-hydroxymethyldihydropteridine diphosphokinase [Acidiferrobacter sp.]
MARARSVAGASGGVEPQVVDAVIGLGANLGDTQATLTSARLALQGLPETVLVRSSSLYRTAPVGFAEQPDFLNAVCWLKTGLSAPALAAELFALERALGRVRTALRDGPRVIDLDLLYYEGVMGGDPELHLPHPRLHERAFVLYPWAEIMPDFWVPGLGALSDLCARVRGQRAERLHLVW